MKRKTGPLAGEHSGGSSLLAFLRLPRSRCHLPWTHSPPSPVRTTVAPDQVVGQITASKDTGPQVTGPVGLSRGSRR